MSLQNATTAISACSVTAHVTVALAAVTRRPDTVLVDVLLAGRVTTVRQVEVIVGYIRPRVLEHIASKKKICTNKSCDRAIITQ